MSLTLRDNDVVEFINEYKIASTDTITEIFFPSLSACQKRMKVIYDNKELNRMRDGIGSQYVYYKKRPKQLRHSLLATDFYRELNKRCDVSSFKLEPKLEGIRPDAVFGYKVKGKGYLGLLEIEISNKGFDFNKYYRFWKEEKYRSCGFPVMPFVFVVGNKITVPNVQVDFNVIVINTDFSNMRVL